MGNTSSRKLWNNYKRERLKAGAGSHWGDTTTYIVAVNDGEIRLAVRIPTRVTISSILTESKGMLLRVDNVLNDGRMVRDYFKSSQPDRQIEAAISPKQIALPTLSVLRLRSLRPINCEENEDGLYRKDVRRERG